jgi:hypothetical protein
MATLSRYSQPHAQFGCSAVPKLWTPTSIEKNISSGNVGGSNSFSQRTDCRSVITYCSSKWGRTHTACPRPLACGSLAFPSSNPGPISSSLARSWWRTAKKSGAASSGTGTTTVCWASRPVPARHLGRLFRRKTQMLRARLVPSLWHNRQGRFGICRCRPDLPTEGFAAKTAKSQVRRPVRRLVLRL